MQLFASRSGAAKLGRPPISEGETCPTFIDESSGEIMEVCLTPPLPVH